MRHSLVTLLVVSALPLVVACRSGAPDAVKSAQGGDGGGTSETKTDVPTGAKVAANSPIAGKDERSGKERPFAGDDPGKTIAIPSKQAWTLGPGDSWVIGLYAFVRSDGTKNIFKGPPGELDFAIPSAYTRAAVAPKGLLKSVIVLVPSEIETTCARVVSASDTEIKVALMDENDKRVEKTFPAEQVWPLDGKLEFAAPVAYKQNPDDKVFTRGVLVYRDDRYAWLQGASRVAPGDVKAVDVLHTYKVGESVFAVPNDGTDKFVPGTITKILNEGLQYEVKSKDGSAKIVEACNLTTSL